MSKRYYSFKLKVIFFQVLTVHSGSFGSVCEEYGSAP